MNYGTGPMHDIALCECLKCFRNLNPLDELSLRRFVRYRFKNLRFLNKTLRFLGASHLRAT